jgi:hypothetical protein
MYSTVFTNPHNKSLDYFHFNLCSLPSIYYNKKAAAVGSGFGNPYILSFTQMQLQ